MTIMPDTVSSSSSSLPVAIQVLTRRSVASMFAGTSVANTINLVMWAIAPRGMSEAVLFGAQFYLIMFANKLSRVSILETK